jgi:hypothetical protein
MASKKKVKKVTKKKAVKKTSKRKVLMRAPDHHRFWAANGFVLSDLHDLVNCITTMDSNHFKHHVNSEKNDFANWVGDILNEKKLATELRKTKTKAATLKKIKDSL